jgi:uncharacterized protein (DUF2062 family)
MPSSPPLTRRQRLRELFTGATSPAQLGVATGIGCMLGVSPFPGMHMALGAFIAWRWKLNAAVILLTSNISFGPLLPIWWALGIAIGRLVRLGEAPVPAFHDLHDRFVAAHGFREMLDVSIGLAGDWVLGCGILMLLIGPLSGGLVYACARIWQRPQ